MQYKETRKSLPGIARELNVDAIVEGTVQRSGDRVRITAQLIYGPTDKHLWAKSYERDMRDEVDVDEEIDLGFAKAAFGTKEAAIERLRADTPNRRKHGAPVFRLESPNDSGAPIAQRFDDGIGGCLCHVQIT